MHGKIHTFYNIIIVVLKLHPARGIRNNYDLYSKFPLPIYIYITTGKF